jgi:MFS family permease
LKRLTKFLYAGIGAGSLLINIAMSGAVIALAQQLRFWAYPTFFGFGMLLSGLVLIVLVPPAHKQKVMFPWLRDRMVIDESRFSKGAWPWVRKRGAFALVLTTTFFVGPFVGALVIRFLGLREQKAWLYAFVTNLISVTVWISVYIGVTDWIRSMLSTVFAAP